MRFYEYESKALFARHGMPLGKSELARSPEDAHRIASELAGPVVIKSQVLSGGRMKAGAVRFADTPEEAASAYEGVLPIVVQGESARAKVGLSRCLVRQSIRTTAACVASESISCSSAVNASSDERAAAFCRLSGAELKESSVAIPASLHALQFTLSAGRPFPRRRWASPSMKAFAAA